MTPDRWNHIKNLKPAAPRLVHNSCNVAMLPHPMNPKGPRVVPWIEKPGRTYNVGRNADKRAKREAQRLRLSRITPFTTSADGIRRPAVA